MRYWVDLTSAAAPDLCHHQLHVKFIHPLSIQKYPQQTKSINLHQNPPVTTAAAAAILWRNGLSRVPKDRLHLSPSHLPILASKPKEG